jgi:hypothetical protein
LEDGLENLLFSYSIFLMLSIPGVLAFRGELEKSSCPVSILLAIALYLIISA